MRKSSSISEFFFVYLFSARHHPLPPESDVPGGVVDDPHQLLLLDALQPVRVKAVPAGTCITKAMNRPLDGALRAAARPWLISNLPLPIYHLIR